MGIIIRQSIKATIINYIGAFIGFLTTMFVITKFLQPEEIGLTKVLLEVGSLFAVFAQLGTSASAMRFFPYFKNGKDNNGFFFYLVTLPLVGCVIFIPLYLFLREPISAFFEKNSSLFVDYYIWVVPLIFFLVYWTVLETYSTLSMRIVIPKFIREIGIRLLLLLLYCFYGFHVIGQSGLVGGFILIYGLAMLAVLWYVSRIAPVSLKHDVSYIDKSLRKTIFRYTSYLIIGALGGTIIAKLDLFMVSAQMGLSYAGIYAIAFYMATVIEIPSRSITAISSPLAAAALKEENLEEANQLYKKVSLHQLIAGSFIFVLIWINIDNIFAIIPNGVIYSQGKWVVFFIGISKLIEVTLSFGGSMITFSKYYRWFLYFTFLITGITIFTNNLFIPVWGMMGAAMATLLTCIISYSLQQWFVLRKIKGNPYSLGTLKQIGVIFLLLGLNCCLPRLMDPWLDGIYRTFIVGVAGVIFIYLLRISDEIRDIIKLCFQRKKN